jgi:hypothetical protein
MPSARPERFERPPPPTDASPPLAPPPAAAEPPPVAPAPSPPEAPPPKPGQEAEGRFLVSLYNTGFQWGISPGVAVSGGSVGFLLDARLSYGFDTGSVIVAPGLRITGYFTDPSVYIGTPVVRVVLPWAGWGPSSRLGPAPAT